MLKGLGALGDMAGMMKKAQEMQGKMAKMQDRLHTKCSFHCMGCAQTKRYII